MDSSRVASRVRMLAVSMRCPHDLADKGEWSLNDFVTVKKLGVGGASAVYQGVQRKTGFCVALKMYYKSKMSPLNMHQVHREVAIHIRLNHPNVVQLWGAFEDEGHIVLVMEYAAKGDLFDLLRTTGGRMKEDVVVRQIMWPFMSGLAYLHANHIIHRDIKLENTLFSADGTLKIADFGLSVDTMVEHPVTRLGTLDYMSPEVMMCPDKRNPQDPFTKGMEAPKHAYNEKVDSWACGVLAYELLVGCPPFGMSTREGSVRAILYAEPKLPQMLSAAAKEFIRWSLTKKHTDRPSVIQLMNHAWIRSNLDVYSAQNAALALLVNDPCGKAGHVESHSDSNFWSLLPTPAPGLFASSPCSAAHSSVIPQLHTVSAGSVQSSGSVYPSPFDSTPSVHPYPPVTTAGVVASSLRGAPVSHAIDVSQASPASHAPPVSLLQLIANTSPTARKLDLSFPSDAIDQSPLPCDAPPEPRPQAITHPFPMSPPLPIPSATASPTDDHASNQLHMSDHGLEVAHAAATYYSSFPCDVPAVQAMPALRLHNSSPVDVMPASVGAIPLNQRTNTDAAAWMANASHDQLSALALSYIRSQMSDSRSAVDASPTVGLTPDQADAVQSAFDRQFALTSPTAPVVAQQPAPVMVQPPAPRPAPPARHSVDMPRPRPAAHGGAPFGADQLLGNDLMPRCASANVCMMLSQTHHSPVTAAVADYAHRSFWENEGTGFRPAGLVFNGPTPNAAHQPASLADRACASSGMEAPRSTAHHPVARFTVRFDAPPSPSASPRSGHKRDLVARTQEFASLHNASAHQAAHHDSSWADLLAAGDSLVRPKSALAITRPRFARSSPTEDHYGDADGSSRGPDCAGAGVGMGVLGCSPTFVRPVKRPLFQKPMPS